MFENTREQEKRTEPQWSQFRDLLIERNRRGDQQCDRCVIEISGSDKCDCARVICPIRVGMNPLMQLRRGAERERPKKSGDGENADKSTRARAAFHWRRLSPRLTKCATLFLFGYLELSVAAAFLSHK